MPGKAFLDTNVLIYALARGDRRSARAEELLQAGGVLSVQVLNEFVSVARRKIRMSWKDIVRILDAIRIFCPSPLPVTIETHASALKVAQKHGYEFYDALIIAAALEGGCTTLYSEDPHDGQSINGQLTIRNPFK